MTLPEKPAFVTEEHLKFLDVLQKGGMVNMFESPQILREAYPELSWLECKGVFKYWSDTFGERHSDE
jgi:hypothetical protein